MISESTTILCASRKKIGNIQRGKEPAEYRTRLVCLDFNLIVDMVGV